MGLDGVQPSFCRKIHLNFYKMKGKTDRNRIQKAGIPGIFKGALEGRARQITEEMKLAAALAIAGLVPEEELNEDNIMPEAFNPAVAEAVSQAVKDHIPA